MSNSKRSTLTDLLVPKCEVQMSLRVSNGEQVQVNVGEQGEHYMMRHFERWWSEGMRSWRASAGPGDVLPIVVELGPPPYAITVDEYAGRTQEIGDRWEQSLYLQRRIRELWNTTG